MPFTSSVDDFVNRILRDDQIANPNRYWVQFTFPKMSDDFITSENFNITSALFAQSSGTVNSRFNNSGQLSMMCTTAQMPGRTLSASEHKHENYPIKIPNSQNYDEVSFGFTLSGNLKERRFFELWQDVIVNSADGTMNFYEEYIADVKIYQLDKQNEITYGVILREAWPISIGPVDYTYASNNEILSTTVTLSYKYWYNLQDDFDDFYKDLKDSSKIWEIEKE